MTTKTTCEITKIDEIIERRRDWLKKVKEFDEQEEIINSAMEIKNSLKQDIEEIVLQMHLLLEDLEEEEENE